MSREDDRLSMSDEVALEAARNRLEEDFKKALLSDLLAPGAFKPYVQQWEIRDGFAHVLVSFSVSPEWLLDHWYAGHPDVVVSRPGTYKEHALKLADRIDAALARPRDPSRRKNATYLDNSTLSDISTALRET